MGFLDRAIKRGIGNAVGNAVESGVRRAVEPKIEQAAASAVNSAANKINGAAASAPQQTTPPPSSLNQAEVTQAANTLGGLFGGLTGAATSFANEAAKNMKICPACGSGAGKDVKFCPSCGAKLPEATVADGAVCSSCGKQNEIGTNFCADCGAKLPCAVAEEEAAQTRDASVMAKWDEQLAAYPKWNCGGTDYNIERYDPSIMFAARLPSSLAAQNAVGQYRELLLQSGFRTAGEYPNIAHLYKKENGVCYHCDTEHCFDGNDNSPSIYFSVEEPTGGFDYVKPEPKKPTSFKDLFGL